MKYASIDIGSNTVVLLICEVEEHKIVRDYLTISKVGGLGRGIDKERKLSQDAIKDALEILKEYRQKIDQYSIENKNIICTGTEALRVATNSDQFVKTVYQECQFQVQILNAEAEAYFTALGVAGQIDSKKYPKLTIMDIGGASTELIQVEFVPEFKLVHSISFPTGSVRGTEWIKSGEYQERMGNLLSDEKIAPYKSDFLLCVAGSMTTSAALYLNLNEFNSERIHRLKIPFEKFKTFVSLLQQFTPVTLLEKFPFLGKRASTIMAGAKVGLTFGEKLGVKEFEISTYGLRYGTLLSFITDKDQRLPERFLFSS